MATFGGLGGLGGSSYPTRFGAPNSEEVGYMPSAIDWRNDWQRRYDAEEARRGQGATGPGMSKEDFIAQEVTKSQQAGTNNTYATGNVWVTPNDVGDFTQHFMSGGKNPWDGPGRTDLGAQRTIRFALGDDVYDKIAGYQQDPGSAGYVPDFSALNAERERMLPLMEGQQRQQQAYDQMRGWGQENAVMGPGYTNPNFGQVNGDFGQHQMGPRTNPGTGGMAGIDPSWTSGVFDQSGGLTGVYGPNTSRKTGFL